MASEERNDVPRVKTCNPVSTRTVATGMVLYEIEVAVICNFGKFVSCQIRKNGTKRLRQ